MLVQIAACQLEKIDLDGDGVISKEELAHALVSPTCLVMVFLFKRLQLAVSCQDWDDMNRVENKAPSVESRGAPVAS